MLELWQEQLGSEFDEVVRYLRPTGKLASHYPRHDPSCRGVYCPPYEVVECGPNRFFGVCPDWGPRIPLTAEQLMLYDVDWAMVRQNLAVALGLEPELEPVTNCFRTHRLGHYRQLSGTTLPIFLMVCFREERFYEDVMALMLESDGPCVLLTPAERWMTPALQDRLHRKQIATLPLIEHVQINSRGFVLMKPLGELLAATIVAPSPTPAIFRRQGQEWELSYAGKTVSRRHLKGLAAIAYLLRHPGRELSVMDVETAALGTPTVAPGSAGPVLDESAISDYRRHCESLREELTEASRNHDLGQQEALQTELEWFEQQLREAVGLGDRRREAKEDLEHCRKRVRNLIDRAVRQIREVHPALAQHLASSITLGRVLCYRTESCPDWII